MSDIRKVYLFIEASSSYGRGLLDGISKYSKYQGPWSFHLISGIFDKLVPSPDKWGADGAIVRDIEGMEILKSLTMPSVVLIEASKEVSPFPYITTDPDQIAEIALNYFLERKFKNFAFSGHNKWWAKERGEVFSKYVKNAGYKLHLNEQPDESINDKQKSTIEWLRSLPKPVAVLASSDGHGQHIIASCRIAGLHIPDEVAVLGIDNDPILCEFTLPPLSSIALNSQKAGYAAAELLDGLMAGKKMESQPIVVDATHVVTRQSTDVMAIADTVVAQAVHFIRNNCEELIQVGDVADALYLSKSSLERRFRKAIGRSVLKEIRRVRVEKIAQMLLETDISITNIALKMNFTNIDHVSRYFRLEMGMPPIAYRKKFR